MTTLSIQGDLLFSTIEQQRKTLEKQLNKTEGAIEINLAKVGRVDSSALSLCLCCLRLAQQRGQSVTFTHLPAGLKAIAELTGVTL